MLHSRSELLSVSYYVSHSSFVLEDNQSFYKDGGGGGEHWLLFSPFGPFLLPFFFVPY